MAHLAQLNVATLRQPLEHVASQGFVDGLDPVNAAGDAADGFVWRLEFENGNATVLRALPDPLAIVNLTVWESPEALRSFAYRGLHAEFFKRRTEWFTPDGSASALWWIEEGSLPTIEHAKQRLSFIDRFGPSPFAFRLGQSHPQLVIRRTGLPNADAERLIGELDAELAALYPEPGVNHLRLDPSEVAPGVGGFFVAYVDGVAQASGAYRLIEAGVAEVKRMYVVPRARGFKLGAAMLTVVESDAVAHGATRMMLETGRRQPEALGLYRKVGYAECECWGEYTASAETSLCLSKDL